MKVAVHRLRHAGAEAEQVVDEALVDGAVTLVVSPCRRAFANSRRLNEVRSIMKAER